MKGSLPTALKPAARNPRVKGSGSREQSLQPVQGRRRPAGFRCAANARSGAAASARRSKRAAAGLSQNLGEYARSPATPDSVPGRPRGARRARHRPAIRRAAGRIPGRTVASSGKRAMRCRQFAIPQHLAAGRRQSGAEGLRVSSARRRAASDSATLHTMDERPSGKRQKSQRARVKKSLPRGVAVRLRRAHVRHQGILMVGVTGGFDAEQRPGLGLWVHRRRSTTGCAVRAHRSRRMRDLRIDRRMRATSGLEQRRRPRPAPLAGTAIAGRVRRR